MNKPTRLVLAAAMAVSFSQAAYGSFKTNDLYLGFTQSSAQSDYIIDLGQPSVVGAGGSSVVDFTSDFSLATFNSIFTGGPNGVAGAVVGGNNVPVFGVYATQIRVGGAGNPAVPGSSLTTSHSSAAMSGGASEVTAILAGGLPSAGNGVVDSTKSYTAIVDTTGVQNNFIGKTGVIPDGTFDGSGILYLDLYHATVSSAYAYLGYFKFDLSTGTPHLTFTPAGAPFTAPPPAPTLTITQSGISNIISFGTTNGATYNLLYNTLSGLTSPRTTWPTMGSPIIGTGGVTNFTDTNVTSGRVYSVTVH